MRAGTGTRLRAVCDALIAVVAVLTVVVPHWPWFEATLLPLDSNVNGPVMAPLGAETGLYAHPSLWVAVGVAVAQLALLLVRHYPGGRLRVPGDGILLAAGSGLVCLIVAADVVLIPRPWAGILSVNGTWAVPVLWEGTPFPLDGYTLVMTWSYGATVAMAAALVSLASTIASPGVPRASRTSGSEPKPVLPPRRR